MVLMVNRDDYCHCIFFFFSILIVPYNCREHNRVVEELRSVNPHWDGDRLYQEGRKVSSTIMITNEFNFFIIITILRAFIVVVVITITMDHDRGSWIISRRALFAWTSFLHHHDHRCCPLACHHYGRLFQIIGAQLQHITWNHWLPNILGPKAIKDLGSYPGWLASR